MCDEYEKQIVQEHVLSKDGQNQKVQSGSANEVSALQILYKSLREAPMRSLETTS
jgi:hypothetical protein